MLRDAIQALTTLVLVISIVNETPHSKRRRIFCKQKSIPRQATENVTLARHSTSAYYVFAKVQTVALS